MNKTVDSVWKAERWKKEAAGRKPRISSCWRSVVNSEDDHQGPAMLKRSLTASVPVTLFPTLPLEDLPPLLPVSASAAPTTPVASSPPPPSSSSSAHPKRPSSVPTRLPSEYLARAAATAANNRHQTQYQQQQQQPPIVSESTSTQVMSLLANTPARSQDDSGVMKSTSRGDGKQQTPSQFVAERIALKYGYKPEDVVVVTATMIAPPLLPRNPRSQSRKKKSRRRTTRPVVAPPLEKWHAEFASCSKRQRRMTALESASQGMAKSQADGKETVDPAVTRAEKSDKDEDEDGCGNVLDAGTKLDFDDTDSGWEDDDSGTARKGKRKLRDIDYRHARGSQWCCTRAKELQLKGKNEPLPSKMNRGSTRARVMIVAWDDSATMLEPRGLSQTPSAESLFLLSPVRGSYQCLTSSFCYMKRAMARFPVVNQIGFWHPLPISPETGLRPCERRQMHPGVEFTHVAVCWQDFKAWAILDLDDQRSAHDTARYGQAPWSGLRFGAFNANGERLVSGRHLFVLDLRVPMVSHSIQPEHIAARVCRTHASDSLEFILFENRVDRWCSPLNPSTISHNLATAVFLPTPDELTRVSLGLDTTSTAKANVAALRSPPPLDRAHPSDAQSLFTIPAYPSP